MADNEKTKVSFFKGLKAEFRKIVWPSQETLINQTVAVVIVSLILGTVIALLDWAFQMGFGIIF